MTAAGFHEVHEKMNIRFGYLEKEVVQVHKKLDDLEIRFTSIEAMNTVVARHDQTIDRLVDDMRQVKTALHLR